MGKKRTVAKTVATMDLVPLCKVPRSIRVELQAIANKQDRPFARMIRAALTAYIKQQTAVQP